MPLVTKCCRRRIKIKLDAKGKQTNICPSCNKTIKLKNMVEQK